MRSAARCGGQEVKMQFVRNILFSFKNTDI